MTLARWQATIVDEAGNIQTGASVTVRREVAGAPLAKLFSDRDGVTPLGNPMTADSDGFAAFHVVGGAYRITATKGAFSRVWRYVGIGSASELDGVAAGLRMRFSIETADSNPGQGYLRFNNADFASVTEIYVSDFNFQGADISAYLDTFDDGGIVSNRGLLTLQWSADERFFIGQITGSVAVDGSPSTYRKLSVTPLAFSTTGTFVTGEIVGIAFNQTGGGLTAPVSLSGIQQISTSRILGRSTAGTGVIEQLTLSQVLDLIGSAAQGDILYRGASGWQRLGIGSAGQAILVGSQGSPAQLAPAWNTLGGWKEIESGSVSNASEAIVDISGYDLVQIWVTMRPNTDSDNIYIRMSQDGGSSFLSGTGDYRWGASWGADNANSASDTEIHTMVADDYSNVAAEATELFFTIRKPNGSGNHKTILWTGAAVRPAGETQGLTGGGRLLDNTNAIDTLRFFASSGNITMDWHAIGMNLS